jgi:hypothetical protein
MKKLTPLDEKTMKAITAIEKYQKTPQKIMPWSG